MLRDGDVHRSTELCQRAQQCFSFVDPEGLADTTADVEAAVRAERPYEYDALLVTTLLYRMFLELVGAHRAHGQHPSSGPEDN